MPRRDTTTTGCWKSQVRRPLRWSASSSLVWLSWLLSLQSTASAPTVWVEGRATDIRKLPTPIRYYWIRRLRAAAVLAIRKPVRVDLLVHQLVRINKHAVCTAAYWPKRAREYYIVAIGPVTCNYFCSVNDIFWDKPRWHCRVASQE